MSAKNLFPQDTRVLELATSGVLLTMAIQLGIYGIDPSMAAVQPIHFWVAVLSAFGTIQLIANLYHPYADMLRTFAALGCGALLLWVTLLGAMHLSTGLVLAASNMYAFVVNFNLMRHEWQS